MRRRLVVAIAHSLASLPVAVSFTTDDQITKDVHLSPNGPNSEYAYLADGDLVVDLTSTTVEAEGVNEDGATTVSNIFRVRYSGNQFARVWFTHGSASVTFHAQGRRIQSASEAVMLESNDSVGVGITVAGTDAAERVVVSSTSDPSSSDVSTSYSSTVSTAEASARTEPRPSATPMAGTGPEFGFVMGPLGILATACFFSRRNTVF